MVLCRDELLPYYEEIQVDGHETGYTFTVLAANAWIDGYVKDDDGNPVSDAQVNAWPYAEYYDDYGVDYDILGIHLPQNAQTSAYTLVASDTGKHISITTGGVTVPSGIFSVGDIVTIYNNSSSSQTITQGASVTLRQAGTSNTGNRSLDQYGTSTLLCVASNVFVISGSGLS